MGRVPQRVAEAVDVLLDTFELDGMALQEAHDYRAALAAIDRAELVAPPVKAPPRAPWGYDTPLLFRGCRVSRGRTFKIGGGASWPGPHTDHHPPRVMGAAVVDGRFRMASIHVPPNYGAETVEARAVYLDRLGRWCEARPALPILLAGDWNYPPDHRHIRRLADRIGAEVVHPPDDRFDYVLVRDCHVGQLRRLPSEFGSDHRPVVFDLLVGQ